MTSVGIEFKENVRQFLASNGYTHILSIGIDTMDENIYWLEPLKQTDPRLQFEETDLVISAINSLDVEDIILGAEPITFKIKIPVELLSSINE